MLKAKQIMQQINRIMWQKWTTLQATIKQRWNSILMQKICTSMYIKHWIMHQKKGQDTIIFVNWSSILTFVLHGLAFEEASSFRHPETERHNRNHSILYTNITVNSSTEPTQKTKPKLLGIQQNRRIQDDFNPKI